MKEFLKKRVQECMVMELLETMVDEDYPTSFDMAHFKTLRSFAERVRYCEANLQRISSGSSRIVYKIDNEKVLKLAKNQKGLAQNETEIQYSGYHDIQGILAKVFEYDENNLWTEMELARKINKPIFKQITGFDFDLFGGCLRSYYQRTHGRNPNMAIGCNKETEAAMWEDEFGYSMLDFIGSYGVPAGDLTRLSSYGVVKRDGQDTIVMIDYGLTSEVYSSYYS